MMRVLGKLSTYALQIAIGSALTFAGVAGVQTLRLSAEQGAHAKTQKQHEHSRAHVPMALLLSLSLSACASGLPLLCPPPVDAPEIPPLPSQAQQPEPPGICSPTCSAGLTRLRTKLLDMLTTPASPDAPASAATTP